MNERMMGGGRILAVKTALSVHCTSVSALWIHLHTFKYNIIKKIRLMKSSSSLSITNLLLVTYSNDTKLLLCNNEKMFKEAISAYCFLFLEHVFLLDHGIDLLVQLQKARYVFQWKCYMISLTKRGSSVLSTV